MRYQREQLRHRERMAALEKGAQLPAFPVEAPPWTPRVYPLRGRMWLFGGIGLTAFLIGVSLTADRMESFEDRLIRIQDMRDRGIADEQLKRFEHTSLEKRGGLPEGGV